MTIIQKGEPMSDLIDRQAAIDACFDGWNNSADDCARNIKSIPAADVVPVVRCKDCKQFRRWVNTDIEFCDLTESTVFGDDFCSRGERGE